MKNGKCKHVNCNFRFSRRLDNNMGDLYVDEMNHSGQLLYFAVSYFSFRELQETFSLLNLGRNFAGMVDVLKGNWGRRNIILSLLSHCNKYGKIMSKMQ